MSDPAIAHVVMAIALSEAGCDADTARHVEFKGRVAAHTWCSDNYAVVGYHGRHQVTATTSDPGPAGEAFLTSVKVGEEPFFGPVAIPPRAALATAWSSRVTETA